MNVEKRIKKLLETNKKVLIAIDGQSGSGKSTIAKKLADEFDGLLIHMDDYFLPPQMKTPKRLSQSGGNVHFERLKDELFTNLDKEKISLRKYNCMTNELENLEEYENRKLIIIEGVYSLHKELREAYHLKILLKVSKDTQLSRIENRSGEKMLKRFITEWIPLENHYFTTEKIEEIADLIIENS